jgi:phosphoribosyl-ATP pyrophosphohydrolase/phosphoribosyl-AMP cyclohydrolase
MKLKLNDQGLIPAIAQDEKTGAVLMVAYMSPESLQLTQQTGEATFYSRTRKELWRKGETSGNVIKVHRIEVDCDADTLVLKSTPTGPACHTGQPTCFFQELPAQGIEFERPEPHILDELFQVIESRKTGAPSGSYVAKLLHEGMDRIGKKVIEEAGETVIAGKNGIPEETIHEVADLWFHSLILLSASGLTPEDIWKELRSRRK